MRVDEAQKKEESGAMRGEERRGARAYTPAQ